MAEVPPEEEGAPQLHLCQEEEFPHLVVKISKESICPSWWWGRHLGTQTPTYRASTWTRSLAGTHLVSGRGSGTSGGSTDVQGRCELTALNVGAGGTGAIVLQV